jgi:hypothetical protein
VKVCAACYLPLGAAQESMTSTVALTGLGIALILVGVSLLALATLRVVGHPSLAARVWPYAFGGFGSALTGDVLLNFALD